MNLNQIHKGQGPIRSVDAQQRQIRSPQSTTGSINTPKPISVGHNRVDKTIGILQLGCRPCLWQEPNNSTGLRTRLFELHVYSGLVDTVGNRIAIYLDHQGVWSPSIEARCVFGSSARPTIKGSYPKNKLHEALLKYQ